MAQNNCMTRVTRFVQTYALRIFKSIIDAKNVVPIVRTRFGLELQHVGVNC